MNYNKCYLSTKSTRLNSKYIPLISNNNLINRDYTLIQNHIFCIPFYIIHRLLQLNNILFHNQCIYFHSHNLCIRLGIKCIKNFQQLDIFPIHIKDNKLHFHMKCNHSSKEGIRIHLKLSSILFCILHIY